MAKTDFRSVDDYLASRPEAVRRALERVRGAIRKAVPDADEVISYQIPAYRLHGSVMLCFAGWRDHYSLYPATDLMDTLKEALAPYAVSKGTIRFPLAKPVPVGLIARIAKLRAKIALARAEAKAAARRTRRPPAPR